MPRTPPTLTAAKIISGDEIVLNDGRTVRLEAIQTPSSATQELAEQVKNKIYLNFGDDWKKDFTVESIAHDFRNFRDANIDPLKYQSKNIRVRGWVIRDFGPMIIVNTPAQIEEIR